MIVSRVTVIWGKEQTGKFERTDKADLSQHAPQCDKHKKHLCSRFGFLPKLSEA